MSRDPADSDVVPRVASEQLEEIKFARPDRPPSEELIWLRGPRFGPAVLFTVLLILHGLVNAVLPVAGSSWEARP